MFPNAWQCYFVATTVTDIIDAAPAYSGWDVTAAEEEFWKI